MFILYFAIIISSLLFFIGFFPITTQNLDVDNDLPTELQGVSFDLQQLYTTNISKTVFIVIDALRLDFVSPHFMPFTSQLVHEKGCFNRVKVEIPTVTLPRIKALTAGNIPQFIDLVLNLASTEILSDSIIHSAVNSGKKIVFYGDDTWLKLFPNIFLRSEGTNSFFVRDFTEVDNNVTRNVDVELKNGDWDMMILHYLGLDHIGHVYGPFSSLVPTKLKEMDQIINDIHKTISSKHKETLLVVTGDHGMRDSGGHGGSTYSETNVPFLIIGSKCENNSFPQTDIPVNLGVLLGLKIPSLAIGKLHKSVTQLSIERYLYALYYNAFFLNQKHVCCKTTFNEANDFYADFLKNSNLSSAYKATELYENYLETVRHNLAKGSSKQNMQFLIIGSTTMLNCLVILFLELVGEKCGILKYVMMFFVVIQFVLDKNIIIYPVILALSILTFLKNVYTLVSLKVCYLPKFLHFLIFCSFLHPVTFLSSSYVEEEHQFWYFFNIIILFILLSTFLKKKNIFNLVNCIALLAIFRFLRTMNSTGDKWSSYPDLSDWLLQNENFLSYQIIFILGLIFVFAAQYYLLPKNPLINLLNIITLSLIYLFKQEESNVLLGRLIWYIILAHFILTFKYSIILSWTLVISLLLKPYNVILVPYCIFSSLHFSKNYKNTKLIVLYNTFLSNMLYFAQGHSNSLASVDISVGYIGLTSYQPILVVSQVLCHTQAFPVLCHFLLFNTKGIEIEQAWKILFCSRLYIYLVTCGITFLFRHHLFIWSVFSPKLFIETVHLLFLFLEYLLYNLNLVFSTKCELYRLLKLQVVCLKSKINDT